jgi:alkanesulfonate monooxygenase SsuD/methylene tetrahydromethanopterin reductase-like flavin-dependent oxidoreductase (luciferase family)
MELGIGLPSTIPGVTGEQITSWAMRAEAAGFSTLGTIDRIAYANVESLIALSAAAAVTSRIRLTTAILIAPYRANAALLAKQWASLDVVSNGRVVAGIAVGGRPDDYEVSGVDFSRRGRILDDDVATMRAIWAGNASRNVGPAPVQPGGPPLIFGGNSDAAFRRVVEHGAGWIAGGGGPEMFAAGAERARSAWRDAGRSGQPRLLALAYYALGDGAADAASAYLHDYYGFLGEWADRIAQGALSSPEAVRGAIDAFTAAGCDELILFPCSPDPGQVDLLASARS